MLSERATESDEKLRGRCQKTRRVGDVSPARRVNPCGWLLAQRSQGSPTAWQENVALSDCSYLCGKSLVKNSFWHVLAHINDLCQFGNHLHSLVIAAITSCHNACCE